MEEFSKHSHFLFIGCSLKGNDRYMKIIKDISLTGTYHYAFMQYPNSIEEYYKQNNTLSQHGIYAIWYPHGKHDESLKCLFNYLYFNKKHEYINIDKLLITNTISKNVSIKGDTKMKPYDHQEDIIDSPTTMIYETAEKELLILFRNGDFSLTLPAEWSSHFILFHNSLYSKIAFNNKKYDGKIVSIIPKNELELNWPFKLIGYYNNTYYYAVRVTDVRCDINNKEEAKEYEKLYSSLGDVLSSAKSYSDDFKTRSRVFKLPADQFIGVAISDNAQYPNKLINCYSNDVYINEKNPEIMHQIMPYWEIHARKAVYFKDVTWYECYNYNENFCYGWIESNNIVFESSQTQISKRIFSNEPIISANLKVRWATKDDVENAIKYNPLDEIENNIAFTTDKNVTEFCIYSKDINNRLTLTYRHRELKANQCLLVGLAFPGDFSAYEISFLDENGLKRQYVISVSGRDGSILLS